MSKNHSKIYKQKFAMAVAVTVLVFFGFSSLPSGLISDFKYKEAVMAPAAEAGVLEAKMATNPKAAAKIAGEADKGISDFIARMIGGFANVFIWLEGGIIYLETIILLALMKYNGFVVSPAVNIGWTLVRDISNLFFVLILLAISIGTILHIESYNFKRLLPKVILMAVLVNFSRLICGLIIDFAQVIMMTFAAAFAGTAGGGHLYEVLRIKDIVNGAQTAAGNVAEGKTGVEGKSEIKLWEVAASAILAIVLLLIAIIVILVILVVIMMRMVMLWLLVVLSPIAYIMAAFPQGQRYAQQWWQEFSKYVIIGPVLAFFLWLTFAIATGTQGTDNAKQMGLDPEAIEKDAAQKNPAFFTAVGENPGTTLQFIIAIGMLMGGLMITQQMGVAGSGFAGNMYNKIRGAPLSALKKPLGLGKAGLRELGGLVSRRAAKISKQGGIYRLAALASPRTIKEGFAAAKQRAEREAYTESAAGIHDVINRYNPLIQKKTHYQKIARRTDVRQQASEVEAANLSEIELAMEVEEELNSKNPEPTRVEALLRGQKTNKQEDDWLVTYRKGDYGPNEEADIYDRVRSLFGQEEADNIFGSLTDYGEGLAKTRGYGNVSQDYDPKTDKIVKTFNRSASRFAKEAQTRLNRSELQKLLPGLEGKAFRKLTYGDKEGDNAGKGKEMIDALSNKKIWSNMTDFESKGAALFSVLPTKLADIITRRGHNMAERVKETIGFTEDKDKNGMPTGNVRLSSAGALVDSFRLNPEVAASVLGNLKLSGEQFSFIRQLLTSEAAKGAGIDDKSLEIIDHLYSKGLLKDKENSDTPITLAQTEFLNKLKIGDYKFQRVKDDKAVINEDKDGKYRPTELVEKTSFVAAPTTPPPVPAEAAAETKETVKEKETKETTKEKETKETKETVKETKEKEIIRERVSEVNEEGDKLDALADEFKEKVPPDRNAPGAILTAGRQNDELIQALDSLADQVSQLQGSLKDKASKRQTEQIAGKIKLAKEDLGRGDKNYGLDRIAFFAGIKNIVRSVKDLGGNLDKENLDKEG